MAALAAVIAGRYTGTWNSLSTGLLDDSGFRLSLQIHEQLINRSDGFAQTLIETVGQGANWSVMFTMLEWGNAAMATILYPYGTLGLLGTIAKLGTGVGKSLVLTATAGTPAATSPATLTATLSKASQNSNTEYAFTSAMRSVPIRMDLLPDNIAAVPTFFSTT